MAFWDDPYRKEREQAELLNKIGSSQYDPAYCDEVIEHFEECGSFKTFAEKLKMPYPVIMDWQRRFPEFKMACLAARDTPGAKHLKYNPIYCQIVIQERSRGKSLKACAAKIGVTLQTIKYWTENIPDFREAVEIAEAKAVDYWESLGILAVNGKIKNFNGRAWDLVMRSQFDWNPKSEIKHEMSGPNGSAIPTEATVTSRVEIYVPANGRDQPEQDDD